jgi:hypothetical protein
VERWHLIDGGNTLEVNIRVDDPDTFFRPRQTFQRIGACSDRFSRKSARKAI